MKNIKLLSILLFTLLFFACDKMEDNYKQYEDMQRLYSPKITNLTATVGLKTATLEWDNPEGDLAKKIVVDFQDDILKFESLVDSVTLENLEIKGYNISVYTIDAFGNYSIPVSIQIFPNGEN